jgi:hypothetical protein
VLRVGDCTGSVCERVIVPCERLLTRPPPIEYLARLQTPDAGSGLIYPIISYVQSFPIGTAHTEIVGYEVAPGVYGIHPIHLFFAQDSSALGFVEREVDKLLRIV